jgi:hypothetical protein
MPANTTLVAFTPASYEPPPAAYATLDVRNAHPVLDFDAATDESAHFTGVLPQSYSGGGLTATLIWAASTATSGSVRWDAAVERLEDEGTDLDSDSFAAAQSVTSPAPAASGGMQYASIGFLGSQIDSLAAGEAFRLKITRDADHADDTMAGDAELVAVEIRES